MFYVYLRALADGGKHFSPAQFFYFWDLNDANIYLVVDIYHFH